MIYGTPSIHYSVDRTDRVGIRQVIASLMWQPSRWPMSISEKDAEAPEIPDMPGGLWLIGKQDVEIPGGIKRLWSFEGVDGDGKSVTWKDRSNSPDYQFQPGFAQVSLAKHKRFQQLLEDYQGTFFDGQIIFPPTLSGAGGVGLAGLPGQDEVNPLFGHDDFYRIEGTYTYRYVATSESEIPSTEGKIFEAGQLPGRAKRIAGRNYIGAGSPYTRRGPVLDVQEIYWLSGEGGWPLPIYGGDRR